MQRTFDENRALAFFRQHPLMTLATVSPAGVPEMAMVYVHVDADMNCYCATRNTTRKFSNITENSIAVLSAYDETELMLGELSGTASIVESVDEIARVMPELQKIVMSRKSDYWVPPVSQLDGEGYTFIKIQPAKALFINYEQSLSDHPVPHRISFEITQ